MNNKSITVIAVSTMLCISACSKSGHSPDQANSGTEGVPLSTSATAQAQEFGKTDGAAFARQPLQDISSYKSVAVGDWRGLKPETLKDPEEVVRHMYWTKAERNDEILAYDLLPEYRKENDTFKRADIVKAKKQALDRFFAEAKSGNYFALESDKDSNVVVEQYDVKEKGFEVRLDYKDGAYYGLLKSNESNSNPSPAWDIVPIGCSTGTSANSKKIYYHPKNEEEAREISAKIAKAAKGTTGAQYFASSRLGHIMRSSPSTSMTHDPTIIFVTDGVVVRSPDDRTPVFVIDRAQLGTQLTVTEDRLRAALELPPNPINRMKYM